MEGEGTHSAFWGTFPHDRPRTGLFQDQRFHLQEFEGLADHAMADAGLLRQFVQGRDGGSRGTVAGNDLLLQLKVELKIKGDIAFFKCHGSFFVLAVIFGIDKFAKFLQLMRINVIILYQN